jgi:hypothetical protein
MKIQLSEDAGLAIGAHPEYYTELRGETLIKVIIIATLAV